MQEEVSFVISATWRHGGLCLGLTPIAISNRSARIADTVAAPVRPWGPRKRPHCGEIEGRCAEELGGWARDGGGTPGRDGPPNGGGTSGGDRTTGRFTVRTGVRWDRGGLEKGRPGKVWGRCSGRGGGRRRGWGRDGAPGGDGGGAPGRGAGGPGGGARAGTRGPGMASMAAAIAASRSAVMSGNRPLDDRERKRFTYFSSLSPMARKIMQDKEKIREKYGPEWARLPPAQQDEIIDRCLVGPRAPPAADAGDLGDPARFPGLRGPTGQKLVRFGDEVGAAGLGRSGRSGRREGVQTSPGEGSFTDKVETVERRSREPGL